MSQAVAKKISLPLQSYAKFASRTCLIYHRFMLCALR